MRGVIFGTDESRHVPGILQSAWHVNKGRHVPGILQSAWHVNTAIFRADLSRAGESRAHARFSAMARMDVPQGRFRWRRRAASSLPTAVSRALMIGAVGSISTW